MSNRGNNRKLISTEPLRPANAEQIGTLHGLMLETEKLARQVNYPVTALFYSIFLELLRVTAGHIEQPVNQLIYKLTEKFDEYNIPLPVFFLLTLPLLRFPLYLHYRFWNYLSSRVLDFFPNGISFDRKLHPSHQAKKRICSESEAKELIADLRQLITKQHTRKNQSMYLSLAGSLIAVYPFLQTTEIGLTINIYGPGIEWLDPKLQLSPAASIVKNTARAVQRIPILGKIYNTWSNYNTPKQLQNYSKDLANFNFSKSSWQLLDKPSASKSTAVFSLTIPYNQTINFVDQSGNTLTISPEHYITELHRTLLTNNVPVFRGAENTIYAGYSDFNRGWFFNRNPLPQIQNKFKTNLAQSAHYEKSADKIAETLNKFNTAINSKNTWGHYRSQSADGTLESHFYTSLRNIPRVVLPIYIAALAKLVPTNCLSITEDILTLKKISTDISADVALTELTANIEKTLPSNPVSVQSETHTTPIKRKAKKAAPAADIKQDSTTERTSKPYPKEINFSSGVKFLRSVYEKNQFQKKKPERGDAKSEQEDSDQELGYDLELMSAAMENGQELPKRDKVYVKIENGIIKYKVWTMRKKEWGTIEQKDWDRFGVPIPTSFEELKVQKQKQQFLTLMLEKEFDLFRAYPLHVAWLSEGTAYASIAPETFAAVRTFISIHQLNNYLETGTVHGQSKSDKTKAGAVGTQVTDEPYQTTLGENIPCAAFKLKFFNNVGIYCRKLEEMTVKNDADKEMRVVHYRYDGWYFRH